MNSPEKMKFPADLQGLRRSFILAGGEVRESLAKGP
uniref:Uncharacterized protein n=1 Tax=Medicago truncatula TaxID=3880 RepID=A2Q2B3_MEDTR|nr:hypothetical protein MtrDRAFT_AC149642g31v2 [Medicago truncatula]